MFKTRCYLFLLCCIFLLFPTVTNDFSTIQLMFLIITFVLFTDSSVHCQCAEQLKSKASQRLNKQTWALIQPRRYLVSQDLSGTTSWDYILTRYYYHWSLKPLQHWHFHKKGWKNNTRPNEEMTVSMTEQTTTKVMLKDSILIAIDWWVINNSRSAETVLSDHYFEHMKHQKHKSRCDETLSYLTVCIDYRSQQLPGPSPAVHAHHAQDLEEAKASQCRRGEDVTLATGWNHCDRGDEYNDVWGVKGGKWKVTQVPQY